MPIPIIERTVNYIFDQWIFYPLIRLISQRFDIQFMNLGYLPAGAEPTVGKLDVDEERRPHVYLYEKTLSLCPEYSSGFQNSGDLLEVGCGSGGGLQWIQRTHRNIRNLIGVDKCLVPNENVKIIEGDACNLPFTAESFDLVLNVESSHLYADQQGFFDGCFRTLRDGGYLCWCDLRDKEEAELPFICAQKSGFHLIQRQTVNKQITLGLETTSKFYDAKLLRTPWYIQIFSPMLRRFYCAPGTPNFARIRDGEKIYRMACWQKPASQ